LGLIESIVVIVSPSGIVEPSDCTVAGNGDSANARPFDPDVGPGNSSKGPNDGGARCHPPGQTVNEPGWKWSVR